jgi:phospholipase/carboxylesterase
MDGVQRCTFSARLDCHYLVHVPPAIGGRTTLVVALHGFGQTPEVLLPLVSRMMGEHVIAAVEGPNQFFLPGGGSRPGSEVGCGWVTRRHAQAGIRLHHEIVLHVLSEAGREYGIPPERRLLLGFSQPVSLNYRFAATWPEAVRGVIGICGGLPGDWESGDYQAVQAAALHIARREDEYYPPAVTEQYADRLRLRTQDVEFHMLDGGHRFPSAGKVIVDGWLGRILSR